MTRIRPVSNSHTIWSDLDFKIGAKVLSDKMAQQFLQYNEFLLFNGQVKVFVRFLVLWPSDKAKEVATPDPTRLPRWKRVRVMSQIFWDETLILLSHAQNAEMQEAVLRSLF